MIDDTQSEYFAGRERRERELAEAARDPAIAAIHRDMADRYATLLPISEPSKRS